MAERRLQFEADGFEIRRAILDEDAVATVRAHVSVDRESSCATGIRNLDKKYSCIAEIANSPTVRAIAESLLDGTPHLVRAIFFDKTAERNWFVAWHQDRTVALDRHIELDGWALWTMKDGVHHVQPPKSVLDRMITIRLHIDAASELSGCLSVIPGSHRLGVLGHGGIERIVARTQAKSCAVEVGDAVVMHPLILHASAKSQSPCHRRLVHLEYSSYELPPGVAWA